MSIFIINSEIVRQDQISRLRTAFPPEPQEPVQFLSDLGTPVYSFVEFTQHFYENLDGQTIRSDGIRLTTVLVEWTQVKNISTTPIQGRDFTVKEYSSAGDWEITLSGRIVNRMNAYPESEMNAIKELIKIPEAVQVICPPLNKMDITYVLITEATFREVEGSRNQVDFEIMMLSDEPLILQELVQ